MYMSPLCYLMTQRHPLPLVSSLSRTPSCSPRARTLNGLIVATMCVSSMETVKVGCTQRMTQLRHNGHVFRCSTVQIFLRRYMPIT